MEDAFRNRLVFGRNLLLWFAFLLVWTQIVCGKSLSELAGELNEAQRNIRTEGLRGSEGLHRMKIELHGSSVLTKAGTKETGDWTSSAFSGDIYTLMNEPLDDEDVSLSPLDSASLASSSSFIDQAAMAERKRLAGAIQASSSIGRDPTISQRDSAISQRDSATSRQDSAIALGDRVLQRQPKHFIAHHPTRHEQHLTQKQAALSLGLHHTARIANRMEKIRLPEPHIKSHIEHRSLQQNSVQSKQVGMAVGDIMDVRDGRPIQHKASEDIGGEEVKAVAGPRLAQLQKRFKRTHPREAPMHVHKPATKVSQSGRHTAPKLKSKQERFKEEVAVLGPRLAKEREAALDTLATQKLKHPKYKVEASNVLLEEANQNVQDGGSEMNDQRSTKTAFYMHDPQTTSMMRSEEEANMRRIVTPYYPSRMTKKHKKSELEEKKSATKIAQFLTRSKKVYQLSADRTKYMTLADLKWHVIPHVQLVPGSPAYEARYGKHVWTPPALRL